MKGGSSGLKCDMNSGSDHCDEKNGIKTQVVWLLISILLLLYVITACVYWAKTGAAWPIGRLTIH